MDDFLCVFVYLTFSSTTSVVAGTTMRLDCRLPRSAAIVDAGQHCDFRNLVPEGGCAGHPDGMRCSVHVLSVQVQHSNAASQADGQDV